MPKALLAVLAFWSVSLQAQQWSVGVGTGPFVFGDFVTRTMRIGNEGSAERQTATLSAATRPGLLVDIERQLGERFSVRAEATFTRAPLAIKSRSGGSDVSLESGDMDATTFLLPVIVRLNPRGSFRFHGLGGPAYAAYRIIPRQNAAGTIRVFKGTRTEWGLAFGGGVAWQWSERLAVEGQITDIRTGSPFRESELGGLGTVEIPKTHNVHTTVGVRYRF